MYLVQAYYRDERKVKISDDQHEEFNRALNVVREEIRNNGNLDALYQLLKSYSETDVPYDLAVKGGFDANGDWHTNFMVYVVHGELRATVIHDIVDDNKGKSDRATLVKDKSVTSVDDQTLFDTAAELRRRVAQTHGTSIDLGSLDEK